MMNILVSALLIGVWILSGVLAPDKLRAAPGGGRAMHTDNPKSVRVFEGARFALLFAGLCLIVSIPLTAIGVETVGSAISGIVGAIAGGSVAASFAALGLILAVVGLAFDLIDAELDRLGRVCLIAVPFLAAVAQGNFADSVNGVTGGLQQSALASLSGLFT